ncbi:OLC1v1028918C1 [Oldenlandia corymbosa var. corymbosa]|uniref:OLC1v1028918C1 n=1 Tax=Oldenlandia corymbosa var. corymbosa TaxID=529605 RepID=A0AAV1CCV8_OLDCO|nr:OLC1v1028918C1 [Oldenlandia corymbosa var. corymbosa]
MLLRTKIPFLILLVLVLVCSFSGSYGSYEPAAAGNDINTHFKAMQQASRKLLSSGGVNVLDYHDPGANPIHDPGKGRSGPGGHP